MDQSDHEDLQSLFYALSGGEEELEHGSFLDAARALDARADEDAAELQQQLHSLTGALTPTSGSEDDPTAVNSELDARRLWQALGKHDDETLFFGELMGFVEDAEVNFERRAEEVEAHAVLAQQPSMSVAAAPGVVTPRNVEVEIDNPMKSIKDIEAHFVPKPLSPNVARIAAELEAFYSRLVC